MSVLGLKTVSRNPPTLLKRHLEEEVTREILERAPPMNVMPLIAQSRRSPLVIAALALVGLKLWLVAAQPVVAPGDYVLRRSPLS